MPFTIYLIVFIFGICIGSFLNCVIYRLAKNESFLFSRSYCPKCGKTLAWYDLIPLLSFLLLRGKCRYCHQKISWQYPIIEALTGFLFLLIFYHQFGGNVSFQDIVFSLNWRVFLNIAYYLTLTCFFIVIAVYDLKHYSIPDKVVYPAISLVFLYQLFIPHFNVSALYLPLLSALLASAFFFSLWGVSRGKWMGFGDVQLAFLLGLFLSFPGIIVALFSAIFIGAIIGLGLIAARQKTLKSEVPFGPFLVTGAFIALFWGENIIHYYIHFLSIAI